MAGQPFAPCLNPVERHGIGLPSPLVPSMKATPILIPARCRKCANCLSHRRRLWTSRARAEVFASRRTWFGTLTVGPLERFKHELAADLLRPSGMSSEKWPEYKFGALARSTGAEATRMFKRLRANGARFRYLLVTEAHGDGWPHLHLLLHEIAEPVRKATLDSEWPLGFSQWRLVDTSDKKAASYVCKYLAKSALTRVRASQRYGQTSAVPRITERLQEATRSL